MSKFGWSLAPRGWVYRALAEPNLRTNRHKLSRCYKCRRGCVGGDRKGEFSELAWAPEWRAGPVRNLDKPSFHWSSSSISFFTTSILGYWLQISDCLWYMQPLTGHGWLSTAALFAVFQRVNLSVPWPSLSLFSTNSVSIARLVVCLSNASGHLCYESRPCHFLAHHHVPARLVVISLACYYIPTCLVTVFHRIIGRLALSLYSSLPSTLHLGLPDCHSICDITSQFHFFPVPSPFR